MDAVMALLNGWFSGPPNVISATALEPPAAASSVAQSMSAMICEYVPEPWQLSTRTDTSVTSFATPVVWPPTVAAMCVPWPLQSLPGGVTPPTVSSGVRGCGGETG
jgi:hypothetical protein